MSMISDDARAALSKYTDELSKVDEEEDAEERRVNFEYRVKMEPLLEDRHKVLNSVANYWSGVLGSTATPVFSLMNGTIDSKIVRAITDFRVTSRMDGDRLVRKVIITLRPNMFVEPGQIMREVDSTGNTLNVTPIQWKQGTEFARKDSLFSFFEKEPAGGNEFVADALDAFHIVFDNPFLAVVED